MMKLLEIPDGKRSRNTNLDCLKALCVIAVVMFHMGFLTYGYLGVDFFLVVAGYFTYKSLLKSSINGTLSFTGFLVKRVIRLWPSVLAVSGFSLLLGYFVMLPDEFENLCESIIASNLFANNILQCITTKNYWDVVNEFKPLMHTWYLGVLVQAYVIIAIIFASIKIIKRDFQKVSIALISVLASISFILFLMPSYSYAYKFYYLPFRFYEVSFGALIACLLNGGNKLPVLRIRQYKNIYVACLLILVLLLYLPFNLFGSSLRLILTCLVSGCLIYVSECISESARLNSFQSIGLAKIGKATLSIYLWHQVVLAFYRYVIAADFKLIDIVVIVLISVLLSYPSYYFLEDKLPRLINRKKHICWVLFIIAAVEILISLIIYSNSGVVRDVPELNIKKDNVTRGMHSKYNDRINKFTDNFPTNNKVNVLVVGDSFARDWANVLIECCGEKINLSYIHPYTDDFVAERAERINDADIIYYAVYKDFECLPSFLLERFEEGVVYVIGIKNFGKCNGIPYNRRNTREYNVYSIALDRVFAERNERQAEKYSGHYVDMISPVLNQEGKVQIFTPDVKFISQDCRHFTEMGAKYYASLLSELINYQICLSEREKELE